MGEKVREELEPSQLGGDKAARGPPPCLSVGASLPVFFSFHRANQGILEMQDPQEFPASL